MNTIVPYVVTPLASLFSYFTVDHTEEQLN
jgi:hypothetical protein